MIKEIENVDELQSKIQSNYNNETEKVSYNHIRCDQCGQVGNFVIHGYYMRKLRFGRVTITIRILRVRCKGCNRTHAIMSSDFIPYSRINTEEGYLVLRSPSINQTDPNISYETLINVHNRYSKRFKGLFDMLNLSVTKDTIIDITKKLIDEIKLTFLQIHRGRVLSLACLDMQTT